jgi:4-amino-4-deoxy-L-arabinose transferase-like glycosyltransferase
LIKLSKFLPRRYPGSVGVTLAFLCLARFIYWFWAYPNPDEAYYWLWGRHLDWSYYDHPPLHAWIQGLFYVGFGKSLGVLRLPTLISSGLFFYTEYCLVRYLYGRQVPYRWPVVVSCTLVSPLYFVFLMMAWHDQWLITFSLIAAYSILRFWDSYLTHPPGESWRLYLAGATLGLASLCKYTALFVGLAGLAVIISQRPLRSLLRDRRLYGAIAISALASLPIVIWNAQHDWLSFQYYLTRSIDPSEATRQWSLKPWEVFGFWGFSILILSPLVSWAFFRLLQHKTPKTASPTYRPFAIWLFSLSTGLLSWIALFSTALYYWNIVAYLLLLPGLPVFFGHHQRLFRIAQGIGCLVAAVLVVNYCALPLAAFFGPDGDPDGRMLFGWETVSPIVSETVQTMGADTLLLTTDYRLASALAYALNNPDVLAISARQDQFDVWAQHRTLMGKNAVILADDWHPLTPTFEAQFERLSEPLTLSVSRWQVWIKNYYLYQAYGFQP